MKKNMFASKVADEKDDDKVTSLTYKQIIKLSIKLGKKNEKLKRSNVELKDYIEFLENSCKFLGKNQLMLEVNCQNPTKCEINILLQK